MQQVLLDLVGKGVPIEHAASAAGIHPSTYRRWIVRGTDAAERAEQGEQLTEEEQRLCAFCAAASRARAKAVVSQRAGHRPRCRGGPLLRMDPLLQRSRARRRRRGRSGVVPAQIGGQAAWLLERIDWAEFGSMSSRSGPTGLPPIRPRRKARTSCGGSGRPSTAHAPANAHSLISLKRRGEPLRRRNTDRAAHCYGPGAS